MKSPYRLPTLLLLAAVLTLSGGCSTTKPGNSTAWEAPGHVQHVVLFWLKEPGDPAATRAVVAASKSFRTIPGVTGLKVGRALASDREVVDDSFDVALVIGFEDAQALRDYIDHPTHAGAVREILRPVVEKIVVYDFTEE